MKTVKVEDFKLYGILPAVSLEQLRDLVMKYGGKVLDRHVNGNDGCHNVFIRCTALKASHITADLRRQQYVHPQRFRYEKCKGGYTCQKADKRAASQAVKVTASGLGPKPDEADLACVVKHIYDTLRSLGMPPRAYCNWVYHCGNKQQNGEILLDVGDAGWAQYCCLSEPNTPVFDANKVLLPSGSVVYLYSYQPSQKAHVYKTKERSTRSYVPGDDRIARNNVYDMRLPCADFSRSACDVASYKHALALCLR